MSKNVILIVVVVFVGFFFLNRNQNQAESVNYELVKAQLAHNLVQTTVTPIPDIPNNNEIPLLKDCPLCKGTKIQKHADGHTTPCPYHGTSNDELMERIMDLSHKLANREEDILALNDKLDLIDKNHKTAQLTKTVCNCGCANGGVCTCSECTNSASPTYLASAIISKRSNNVSPVRMETICNGTSCYQRTVSSNYSNTNRFGNERRIFRGRLRGLFRCGG